MSERALREALSFSKAALESTADGLLVVDRQGRIRYFNRRFIELWRIPARIMASRDDEKALASVLSQIKNPAAFLKRVRQLYPSPKESVDEIELRDGRVFQRYSRPQRIGRAVVGRVWSFRDITGMRMAQRELAESEAYWRTLLEWSPEAVTCLDLKGRITFVNRFRGSELKRFIGKSVLDFLHPSARGAYRGVMAAVIASRKPVNFRTYAIDTQSGYAWYDARMGPLFRQGKFIGLIVTSSDITREAMTQARFEGLFKSSRDAMTYTSLDGMLLEVNPAYEHMTGYRREEVVRRKRYQQITAPEYAASDKAAVRRMLATGRPVDIEKEWVRRDGSRVPVELTVFPVRGPDGRPTAMAAIGRDITERRRLERELAEAGAREQSKLGRDLHDTLGQTVTGISLLAKSLRARLRRRAAPEEAEALRLAELSSLAARQARSLASGLLPKELQTAGLGEALRQLAHNAEELFGISCALSLPRNPLRIDEGTAVQLYRIAQEAVTNAAKHSRSRTGVSVKLRLSGRWLRLEVLDQGVGLPSSRRRGKGLGLGIMEHRARLLGGSLSVRRRPEGGTAVVCLCPAFRALQAPR